MPSISTEDQLYDHITQISYRGDKRLEDPNKIRNIVDGNFYEFRKLYEELIDELGLILENGVLERKDTRNLVKNLPEWIQELLPQLEYLEVEMRDEFLYKLVADKNSNYSSLQINHAVRTTDLLKIIEYSWAKVVKAFKGYNK